MASSTTSDEIEAITTNNTMVMPTTNNNMAMTTLKSPWKQPHNEWQCFRQLKQPNKAVPDVLEFMKALAAHGACYRLTVKK